jgi:hypothetical protein
VQVATLALELTEYGVPVEVVDGGWEDALARAAAPPAAA